MDWLLLLLITSPTAWIVLCVLAIFVIGFFVSEVGDTIGKIIIFAYCVWLLMCLLGVICDIYVAFYELFENGDVWEFIKYFAGALLMGFLLYISIKFGLHTWGWILKDLGF